MAEIILILARFVQKVSRDNRLLGHTCLLCTMLFDVKDGKSKYDNDSQVQMDVKNSSVRNKL